MTIYRVGSAGAVVFAPDGAPLVRLVPGMYVVPGAERTMPEAEGCGIEILEKRVRRGGGSVSETANEDEHREPLDEGCRT